jgi:peptidyl-prolyl cis-trans isomerase D
VIDHKPAELQPFDAVRAGIERRLQRDEATRLARADGEAKLKEVQEGKDAGLKWPVPLAVNRQKPGGLPPQVIDRVFRADAKKLPAYAGIEAPAGYALVKISKVIELEKAADGQREQLGATLREEVAGEELDSPSPACVVASASRRKDVGRRRKPVVPSPAVVVEAGVDVRSRR